MEEKKKLLSQPFFMNLIQFPVYACIKYACCVIFPNFLCYSLSLSSSLVVVCRCVSEQCRCRRRRVLATICFPSRFSDLISK